MFPFVIIYSVLLLHSIKGYSADTKQWNPGSHVENVSTVRMDAAIFALNHAIVVLRGHMEPSQSESHQHARVIRETKTYRGWTHKFYIDSSPYQLIWHRISLIRSVGMKLVAYNPWRLVIYLGCLNGYPSSCVRTYRLTLSQQIGVQIGKRADIRPHETIAIL